MIKFVFVVLNILYVSNVNALNKTINHKRTLTSTDVYYGICYNGPEYYDSNLITEQAYIEYIKCHPSKLFELKPNIRTREFINKAIVSKPEIFNHIPLYLRTLEQEYIYIKTVENKHFYDIILICLAISITVFWIYKEIVGY